MKNILNFPQPKEIKKNYDMSNCNKCGGFGEYMMDVGDNVVMVPCTCQAPVTVKQDVEVQKPVQQKETTGKIPLQFVLVDMANEILDMGKVMKFGFDKYKEECGWRRVPIREYQGAVERHLNAFHRGEVVDEESQCYHLAHAAINCMFMLYLSKEQNDKESI